MSILTDTTNPDGRYVKDSVKVRSVNTKTDTQSSYTETPEEMLASATFLEDFKLGWQTMHLPRPEFNDMSLYQRHIIDMLSFNTYQENDGNPLQEDRLGGWKSTALRPIVRNKAISIAAHETARVTVPKIFAYNDENDEQEDSARVMSYLVDWGREQANYPFQALFRVITSLYSPISWGYSEYSEVYRQIKDIKGTDGKWTYKQIIDEDESGFNHVPVPTDQVFFANFYERDAQKQDFIILRRIISYDKAKAKYGTNKNFVHVHPGIVVIMDDANRGFYNVYDPHMRGRDVEEVIRWRKSDDSKTIKVNGIWMTDCDAPNPRQDHQYPFDCFYYLPINERCIAGKSLVATITPEANLINTQYQMINDGFMLNLYPPTVTSGSDKSGIDVIVPGLNLAFADKDVQINALRTASDESLKTAMEISSQVEASINQSSQDPVQQGQNPGTPSTAYEISRIEQNAATVLGLSMKFIAQHAVNYGKLLVSDILQYMTVGNVSDVTGNDGLIYKTFFAKEPGTGGKMNKVKFDATMPQTMTDEQKMAMSFAILKEQGGINSDMQLWKANPIFFRQHKYTFTVDSDVLNPRSAELSRAFALEDFDRMVMHPEIFDPEETGKLLLNYNPLTEKNPDKFIAKPAPPPPMMPPTGQPGQVPGQAGDIPQGKPTQLSPLQNQPLPQMK